MRADYRLKDGDCVTLLKAVDLQPHCIVPAGSMGVVVEADDDFIDIRLVLRQPGLEMYDNTMWLCPRYDDVPSYVTLMHEEGNLEAA